MRCLSGDGSPPRSSRPMTRRTDIAGLGKRAAAAVSAELSRRGVLYGEGVERCLVQFGGVFVDEAAAGLGEGDDNGLAAPGDAGVLLFHASGGVRAGRAGG